MFLKRVPQRASSLVRRNVSTFQRRPFRLNKAQTVMGVSAVGLLAIGTAGLIIDKSTHIWLEHHLTRLKISIDPDTREWGWDLEAERWTGDPNQGGTDAGLIAEGRKAVRDAWFSHHRPEKYGSLDENNAGVNMVDALLLRTEACLRSAIAIAEQPDIVPKLHPCTLTDLLARRAGILERLGGAHVDESKVQYERVWKLLERKGVQAARVALKLGDVDSRLGNDKALAWWTRAIELVSGDKFELPTIPAAPPSGPAEQRLLASALVSISAFYAMRRQFDHARKTEEASLALLRSIRSPEALASTSPPQTLHFLTLLHRSALLSSHLAEVMYVQRLPAAGCLKRLQAAATSSERVAYALVGISVRDSDQLTPSAKEPLLARYVDNPYLEKPASDLLRDARQSAAAAWNLMGELAESMGSSHRQSALQYYTRAIGWAVADSTLRDDFTLVSRNYTRIKQALEPLESK